jgi:ACT domain-containing protein
MRAIVTVIGQDRVGIIADVSRILAERGVNVLDISQTVLQQYFTMIMLVDASRCTVPFAELTSLLKSEGDMLGLDIRAQREDLFHAMHRI